MEKIKPQDWDENNLKKGNDPAVICEKIQCWATYDKFQDLVPPQFYTIISERDQLRAKNQQPNKRRFEDVANIVIYLSSYPSNVNFSDVPEEYQERIRNMCNKRIEKRPQILLSIYFEYKNANNITVGPTLRDTHDKFLLWLAYEYDHHTKFLAALHSRL